MPWPGRNPSQSRDAVDGLRLRSTHPTSAPSQNWTNWPRNSACSRAGGSSMIRVGALAGFAALACVTASYAQSAHPYDKLIATHAAANGVPEALVHRVVLRESRYNATLVGGGGTIGLENNTLSA